MFRQGSKCAIVTLLMGWAALVAAEAGAQVLIEETYETDRDLAVQMRAANQPYEQHTLGLTTDKAHGGRYGLKVDLSHRHAVQVYLAPRSNEVPRIEYGSIGGPGSFVIDGLDIPLESSQRYVLSMWVWVEVATPQNPVKIAVNTMSQSDYGPTINTVYLKQSFDKPTDGWVKVEQELGSYLIDRLDASGANVDGLRLHSILLHSFSSSTLRLTAYVDDVRLVRSTQPADAAPPADSAAVAEFKAYPAVEDLFVWGVYGAGPFLPGSDWMEPLDLSGDYRAEQTRRVTSGSADWIMLDLRRHFCNLDVQGGGMLMPEEGDSAYAYVQAVLDKHEEYGLKFSPSTYLTTHYTHRPREECEQAMKKAAEMWSDHPALLAYWLLDEPRPTDMEDFTWGKRTIESFDSNHPALCTLMDLDSVALFSPILPLVCVDYYPISRVPSQDKGAWAVVDIVRYAKSRGAPRVWLIPQAFGSPGGWRVPTVEEFAIQIFGGLAEGATGFITYSYVGGPPHWYQPDANYEMGNMVDHYGNPSPMWDFMKRWGPYLRSAGPLLVGAKALDRNRVAVHGNTIVASNVGRQRPAVDARLFADPNRPVHYLLVYNNTLRYKMPITLGLGSVLRSDDRVMDLFALREVIPQNQNLVLELPKGEARLFAIGEPEEVERVRQKVASRRFELRRDLAELEADVAERMGTDVTPVRTLMEEAVSLAGASQWPQAEATLAAANALLETQQQANLSFNRTSTAVESTRAALGRISSRLNGALDSWSKDPQFDIWTEQMTELSRRFYTVHGKLYRDGPDGLPEQAETLRDDVVMFKRELAAQLGA